jgi:hypothetical protein
MPDEKEKEIEKPIDSLLKEEKSKRRRKGRPKGPVVKKSTDEVTLLIEEMKTLREDLKETKKQVEEQKKAPASVRLETRKKKLNLPPYSGPTRRVKFMRNDQPENPMNACLKKAVFTKKIDEKTGVETIVKEYLDWNKTLVPGRVYELPVPVVEFLNSRSEPTYAERDDPENPRQTVTTIIGEKHRCFCVDA